MGHFFKSIGFAILTFLAGCQAGPDAPTGLWYLTAMGEGDAPHGVRLEIFEDLSFSGQAPCNGYSGQASFMDETFSIGPIMATRMACEDLDAEVMYLTYLGAVQSASVQEGVLSLVTADGVTLTFSR